MSWYDPKILFAIYSIILIILVLVATKARSARMRHGLLQLVLVMVVFGIILFVEMFSLFKVYKRWDLTENEKFTFSSMTVNLLESMDSEMKATVFSQTSPGRMQYEQLLSIASYYNKEHLAIQYLDPERDFIEAAKFPQPIDAPVLFLQYEGRTERVPKPAEEDLARALTKLLKSEQRKVCLLKGHGEKSLSRGEGESGASLVNFKELLEDQNKQIESFEFDAENPEVPADCDVLLVAGPEVDMASSEYVAIERYVAEGGDAIFMLDNGQAMGVARWVENFGVQMDNDLIIEVEQSGYELTSEGLRPVTTYNLGVRMIPKEHEVAEGLVEEGQAARIYAIESRSVQLAESMPESLTGEIIAESAPNTWAEQNPDYDNLEGAGIQEGIEQEGPVPMAAIVEGDFSAALDIPSATDAPEATVVVFGDSDFPTDRTYGRSYGVNLLLNVVNYLTQDTELISIPPKTEADAPYVRMTGGRWAKLLLVAFVLVPGIVFVIGLGVHIRRRRTG